jgi:hypothetical protein
MKKKHKKKIKVKVKKKRIKHIKKINKYVIKTRKNKKNKTSKNKKKKTSKNKKKKVKSHKPKLQKLLLPIDRIKKLKLPKFKLKKIKTPKIKLKKKQIIKIKKDLSQATKTGFQKIVNFILTPVFRAYDDYFENKKLKKLKKIALEKKEKEKRAKEEIRLSLESKQRELKNEEKFARERAQDLKKFIRHEQAILRREQAEKRRSFLEEIKLDKKIKAFRRRELEEIKSLEKLALQEQREDYRAVEERLEKIKEKYRLIREQKIRERVESLGVEISDTDTKEDILQKEKEYAIQREAIELVLESFYRSANSLVFQLNKRYIPKHKSILRVIDRRYESNECFIRYDDSPDEDWLILIYLEDSDAEKGKIVVENKSNPEKHETKSFETKEIFTYSDYLVDSMTAHIDRERKKIKEKRMEGA